MIAASQVVMGVWLCAGVAVGARAQQVQQPPPPPLKIGALVGAPSKGVYDDGGRRDPFASLIAEKAVTPGTGAESAEGRARGLAGIAVADAAVRGIIISGQKWLAIVAGPGGAMYLAHANDRLHDGVLRRIERDAVVFLTRVPDGTGRIVSLEVRKRLRPGAGDGR